MLEPLKEQSASGGLEFQSVLTHLVSLQRRGVLVPFIGVGMSLPTCSNWQDFLTRLASETDQIELEQVVKSACAGNDRTRLYRAADSVVESLRPLPHAERVTKYRRALQAWGDGAAPIPDQTQVLSRVQWPLVLTTNYDDLYWSAVHAGSGATPLQVMGRNREDCHRVLRSLDRAADPVLWALQGFLGGQRTSPAQIIPDRRRQRELEDQVVVGHQQYQRAINADAHFRRAFAEVFRRRSCFFLGSGLLEDYLINLFSEIIHHQGTGAYPHFALLPEKDRDQYDPRFLQTRLGIVPVFCPDYEAIPRYLTQLSDLVQRKPNGSSAGHSKPVMVSRACELSYEVASMSGPTDARSCRVNVRYLRLPLPSTDNDCSLVSVGRWENAALTGNQASGHVAALFPSPKDTEWRPLDAAPSYVFRYGTSPVFGVAARSRKLAGRHHDRRDLGIIPDAVRTALHRIQTAGFETVNVGPIASGRQAPWHPIHPFAQTLRGIRLFIDQSGVSGLRTINLHVVDWRVWEPIIAGKLPVSELLSSEIWTYEVEMIDADGNSENFAFTLKEAPALGDLLARCNVKPAHWKVGVAPRPMDGPGAEEPESDMIVAPTMRLILTSRAAYSPTG